MPCSLLTIGVKRSDERTWIHYCMDRVCRALPVSTNGRPSFPFHSSSIKNYYSFFLKTPFKLIIVTSRDSRKRRFETKKDGVKQKVSQRNMPGEKVKGEMQSQAHTNAHSRSLPGKFALVRRYRSRAVLPSILRKQFPKMCSTASECIEFLTPKFG